MDDGSSSSRRRKRRRSIGEDSRPWSDIPLDVLCNVMRRLTVRDFVRCGAVCASWRSATLQRQCRPMLEPPWAIPFPYGGSRGFVCPPEGRLLRREPSMPWEMIRSSQYIGSSNGWLGLQRMESVHILHALSGAVLRLPDLNTVPGMEANSNYNGTDRWPGLSFGARWGDWFMVLPFFHSILIVPPPAGVDRDQLTVLAVCPRMRRLLFARPSDVAWSFVDMPAPVDNFIFGLTGYRGSAYAVDSLGRVAAWDYGGSSCSSGGGAPAEADALASGPRFTRIVTLSCPPLTDHVAGRHLVEEANGDLLQVEEVVNITPRGLHQTARLHVFRLEQPGGGEGRWRRLESLGDGGKAVFVGRGVSEAFTCSDFPWLERNCIYFTEGVYNLGAGKIQPFLFQHRWLHGYGNWFIPALRSPATAGPLQT